MDLFGEPDIEENEVDDDTDIASDISFDDDAPQTPRTATDLFGHEKTERAFLDAYNAGRMPHGIILSGPKGIGKSTLAYRLAKFLFKQGINDPNQDSLFGDAPAAAETLNVDQAHPAVRLVLSGGHPDLLVAEREYDEGKDRYKASIAVEEIRKVAPFLRKTASQGGWRVVIIDDADTMSRSAQNALLKILEEPPSNTVLILIAHRMGTMVPTIRSRCRVYNMNPLSQSDFSKLLTVRGHSLGGGELETLYALSEGSIGEALRFIERDGLTTLNTILGMLSDYPRWNWPEIHKLGDVLGKAGKDDAYQQFAELLPWVYTQMIRTKARGTSLENGYFKDQQALQALLRQSSLESLLKICENLEDLFATVAKSNLDKRQAVLSAFTLMAA